MPRQIKRKLASGGVIPELILPNITFTPTVFKPLVFTPTPIDNSIFYKSLEKAKQLETTAISTDTELDKSITGFRSALEQEDRDWLNEQTKKIQSDLDFHINHGNYGTAMKLAQQAAHDLSNNQELQDRLASSTAYKNYITKVNNSNVSEITKARFRDETKYSYKGADYYNNLSLPVAYQNTTQFVDLIQKNTSTKYNQISTSGLQYTNPTIYDWSDPNRDSNVPNYTGSSRSSNVQELSYNDLVETYELMMKDPQYTVALRQEFLDSLWAYKKAQQMLDDPNITEAERRTYEAQKATYTEFANMTQDENGIRYTESDFKRWADNKYKPLLEQRAYKHKSTSTSYTSPNIKELNKPASDANDNPDSGTITVAGDNIEQIIPYPLPPDKSSDEIGSWFN